MIRLIDKEAARFSSYLFAQLGLFLKIFMYYSANTVHAPLSVLRQRGAMVGVDL